LGFIEISPQRTQSFSICVDLPLGQMATTVINPISMSILESADWQADPSNKITHKLKSM